MSSYGKDYDFRTFKVHMLHVLLNLSRIFGPLNYFYRSHKYNYLIIFYKIYK